MRKHLIAMATIAVALQGCGPQNPSAQVYGEDVDGIAKTCEPSTVDFAKTPTANATISMTNDGWCAVRAVEADGTPFKLALVRTRPDHGRVLIQPVSGKTRVEYTPNPGYVGSDQFTVALVSKKAAEPDAMLQVAVAVARGQVAEPAPVAAVAKPAPAPTKAKTPSRAKKK